MSSETKPAKATRSPRGGQVAQNGEFYAGGTFLPNTTLAKMAKRSSAGSRKHRIGPSEWASAPTAGLMPLFGRFSHLVDWSSQKPLPDDICRRNGRYQTEVADMLKRWQSGERWVTA